MSLKESTKQIIIWSTTAVLTATASVLGYVYRDAIGSAVSKKYHQIFKSSIKQDIEMNDLSIISAEEKTTSPAEEKATSPVEEEALSSAEEETTTPVEEGALSSAEEETTTPVEEEALSSAEEETTTPVEEEASSSAEEETTFSVREKTTSPAIKINASDDDSSSENESQEIEKKPSTPMMTRSSTRTRRTAPNTPKKLPHGGRRNCRI